RDPDDGAYVVYGTASVILGLGGWAALRPVWVRIARPEGRPLSRNEAPGLFQALERMRRELRSQPFHEVLVVPDCNAAVVQWPRLGVFGWNRNVLVLGLPLLEGMAPEELRGVLAHEFAHLSRRHNWFGSWIYRLRRSWHTVFEELGKPRRRGELSLRPIVARFARWFWPRFNAHAFVLSRANEFEADDTACRLEGVASSARALVRVQILSRRMEEMFWNGIWRRANTMTSPPESVFEEMRESIRTPVPAEDLARWIEQAFRMTTSNDDTHPCLRERLAALGALPPELEEGLFPPAPAPPTVTAGEELVGGILPLVRQDLSREWLKRCTQPWKDRHAKAGALIRRIEALDQAVPHPGEDADCLWEKARLVIDLEGDKVAAPLLRQILALRPAHAPALYWLGRGILMEGDQTGVGYLERAMEEDEEAIGAAAQALHVHYRISGQTEQVKALASRLDRYEQTLAEAKAEKTWISPADTFLPHGLTEEETRTLAAALLEAGRPTRAHLARKHLKHPSRQPVYVLSVGCPRKWLGRESAAEEARVIEHLRLQLQLPGRVLIIGESGAFRRASRKLRRVSGTALPLE
ncbi:MAG TPA: hypothetical protein DCM86_20615, partial [Verrucomicrobiales bacterium]|nr:hypothetical protein [Verrucomicrobiales bacterium]